MIPHAAFVSGETRNTSISENEKALMVARNCQQLQDVHVPVSFSRIFLKKLSLVILQSKNHIYTAVVVMFVHLFWWTRVLSCSYLQLIRKPCGSVSTLCVKSRFLTLPQQGKSLRAKSFVCNPTPTRTESIRKKFPLLSETDTR